MLITHAKSMQKFSIVATALSIIQLELELALAAQQKVIA